MFCLGNKDGYSFYTYSLHILDQHIRSIYSYILNFDKFRTDMRLD